MHLTTSLSRLLIWSGAIVALIGMGLWSACERPFVEPRPPLLQVLEPDFSTVFVSPNTMLRVEASSFRDVREVRIDGEAMTFNPNRNAWERTLQLQRGLNRYVLTASDVGGVVGMDTLFAVLIPFEFRAGPVLPQPRGGHTATLLPGGSLLVTGGTARAGGPARAEAFLLRPGSIVFERLPTGLHEARTGHTATLLDDGRVLIVGGSRSDDVGSVADLVESAELYDPETRTFEALPFGGQPIRRALHTAVLRSPSVLDLFGGRGDIRYEPEPRLGTRRDLRSLRFTGDSLVALNSLFGGAGVPGAPFLEAIFGHSETPLNASAPGEAAVFLIAGSFFDGQATDDVSFKLDYTRPPQILEIPTPPLRTSRTRHAAVLLQEGFVAFFGGRQETPSSTLDEVDLYTDAATRFFRFPAVQPLLKRYGHTATKLPSQRILLLGGFSADGNSLNASEFFDSVFSN